MNCPSCKLNIFRKRISKTHCHTTFDLNGGTLGIDYQTHILSADHALDLDSARSLVDVNCRNEGYGYVHVRPAGYPEPATAGRRRWCPI